MPQEQRSDFNVRPPARSQDLGATLSVFGGLLALVAGVVLYLLTGSAVLFIIAVAVGAILLVTPFLRPGRMREFGAMEAGPTEILDNDHTLGTGIQDRVAATRRQARSKGVPYEIDVAPEGAPPKEPGEGTDGIRPER